MACLLLDELRDAQPLWYGMAARRQLLTTVSIVERDNTNGGVWSHSIVLMPCVTKCLQAKEERQTGSSCVLNLSSKPSPNLFKILWVVTWAMGIIIYELQGYGGY